jgi:hypothetical protein
MLGILNMSLESNMTEKLSEYLLYTKSLMESMRLSVDTGKEDVWRFSSYTEFARKYNQLLTEISKIQKVDTILDLYDLEKFKSPFDTLPMHQKQYYDSIYSNLSILRSYLENKLGTKKSELLSLKDFFQSNLRKAIFKEPENEKEIQDVIEQLLIGRGLSKGIDYDRETGRIKVSAKEVIPDFILHKMDLALEVKYSKDKLKSKSIIDQINSDIRSYSIKFPNILFVIYDIGSIRDEDEFKNDLDNADNINVVIVKH